MLKNVVKRDGNIEEFDSEKIYKAVKKANARVTEKLDEDKIRKVESFAVSILNGFKKETLDVEEIHKAVENALMKYNCFEVARQYMSYRQERDAKRFKKLPLVGIMESKLFAKSVINQNANLDEHSFGGRKGEMDSAFLKEHALLYYITQKHAKNHINNRVYIHDLDSYILGMHNCLSVPMDELLSMTVKTRQVLIRPAGSVNTAFQLIAVYFQLQSLQQFGGVAATHVDWTLVPYVRKSFMKHYLVAYLKDLKEFEKLDLPDLMFQDYQTEDGVWRNKLDDWISQHKHKYLNELGLKQEDFYFDNPKLDPKYRQAAVLDTISEVKQGAEGMLHNLNSLQSRAGNQLPFSSINYGTCTLPEGRIVIRAILDATIRGTGNGQTSIFPCQIFQLMDGVNTKEGDPNYDLFKHAVKCTSMRMYPNYVNCDWSKDQGYNKDDPRTYPSTMGCRTYSSWDINAPSEELSHIKDGRGNIAPATVILPTLAMEAKRKAEKAGHPEYVVDFFMDILEKAIGDCKDELIERFDWICSQSPASAKFMYDNKTFFSYGDEFEKEGIRGALKHGTLAIGQIGMAETLQILIGCDHTEARGMELAKKIEQLFADKCKAYKEHYKLNFGVYYTPAESLCGTAMKKFQKKYGKIPNVSDREYFTNSIHVPVWKEISPYDKIDIESQLTGYSSAGCITYVEIGDNAVNNLKALEDIVLYAKKKDIPYFALNVRLSECTSCGYHGYIPYEDNCPCCGAGHEYINDFARITGYLSTTVRHFNAAKQAEARDRFVHVQKLKDWKMKIDKSGIYNIGSQKNIIAKVIQN